jgi:hypothetical protein
MKHGQQNMHDMPATVGGAFPAGQRNKRFEPALNWLG